MTATNHALTGALIGLAVGNPALALPVAFLSHLGVDAIPHYDPPKNTSHHRFTIQLMGDATLCGLLVLCLAVSRPQHWLVAALAAFIATSPDLFWLPKYLSNREFSPVTATNNWFWRFHSWIQWKTGPRLWAVELIWFVVTASLFAARL